MKVIGTVSLLSVLLGLSATPALSDEANPLFHETKITNYLPHMTWAEVEEALTQTDMVIIRSAPSSNTASTCRCARISTRLLKRQS